MSDKTDTGGGANVGGNVTTDGGDFIGRDKNIYAQPKTEALIVIDDVRLINDQAEIKEFRRNELKLKDNTSKGKYCPLLDVKVRNAGDKIAALTRIEFEATIIKSVPSKSLMHLAFEVSREYSVRIDLNKRKSKEERYISQVVEPNGVDRFVFMIDCKAQNIASAEVRLDMWLWYNSTCKVSLGTKSVLLYPPSVFMGGESKFYRLLR